MGLTAKLAYKLRHQSSRVFQSISDAIAMKTYSKWKRRRRASCKRSPRRTLKMVTTQMINTRLSKTNKSWIVIWWRLWNLRAISPHYRKEFLKWRNSKRKMPYSKIRQKRAQLHARPRTKVVTLGRILSNLSLITPLWQLHQEQYKPRFLQLSSLSKHS